MLKDKKFAAKNIILYYLKNREIFNRLSFEVNACEILVICGEGRFGKTALIKAICGVEKIVSGSIFCGETQIDKIKQKNRNISAIFSDFLFNLSDIVKIAIAEPLKIRKTNEKIVNERLDTVLNLYNAKNIADKAIKDLTNIERFKVALLRAIIKEPDVILIDDCFSELSQKEVAECCNLLKDIVKTLNVPVVFLTSKQEVVKTLNEKTLYIESGKLLQLGSLNELILNPQATSILLFFGLSDNNFYDFECTFIKGQKRLEFDCGFCIDNIVDTQDKIEIGVRYRAYLECEGVNELKVANKIDLSQQHVLIFSLNGKRIN